MITKAFAQLRKSANTDFVRVTFMSGLATLFRMIAGFVSIKIVAKIIGPSGIALVGQFMNSITMIGSASTGAIGQGVTKYIAEHRDDREKQDEIIGHAVRITVISTIVSAVAVLIFLRPLGYLIFDSYSYSSLIILTALSLVLFSFNTLLINILNGFKDFKRYIVINIVSSVFILVSSVILVWQWNLYGALLNCVISQTLVIAVTLFFIRRQHWISSVFRKVKIKKDIVKKMGAFSLMAVTSAVVAPVSQILVRSYITDHISLNSAGLWEGMNRFSSMYLSVITTSIAIFYLPRLSEIKEDRMLKGEVFKISKIVLPALIVACGIIFVCRDLVISIVFSQEFKSMRELFPVQLIGDVLKIASWLVAYLFFARARVKEYIVAEVVGTFLFSGLSILGVSMFGLVGATYGYALGYLLYLALVVFLLRKILFIRS